MPAKNKAKRPTLKERRIEKRADIDRVLTRLDGNLATARSDQSRADMLVSVANGLYEELEKLSKKAPVDDATDLVVEHVNDVINDVRDLAASDLYVQKIRAFVPADDNPEHRDVVLVLKQVRQGLGRAGTYLERRRKLLTERISLARGLSVALGFCVEEGETQVTEDNLKANGVSLPGMWWSGGSGYFGDEKTVSLDLIDHFEPESLLIDVE